jgi:threonine synthase
MDVFPWDGDGALLAMRATNGIAESVTDKEILEAQKLLASQEGIFAEPTGVASLAGLIKLVDQGSIKRDESVVALITGNGLKDPGLLSTQFSSVQTISPNLEAYEELANA